MQVIDSKNLVDSFPFKYLPMGNVSISTGIIQCTKFRVFTLEEFDEGLVQGYIKLIKTETDLGIHVVDTYNNEYKEEENSVTGEVNYFFDQKELFTFLNSHKKMNNQHYRGSAVEPLENKMYRNPINWHPGEMGKDDSIDYIEDYRQFKSNLKSKYQPISVSLFLKNYPRLLLQEEVLKLSKLK